MRKHTFVLGALLVCLAWAAPAAAQTTEIEMLSKADALRIFSMSRQQWDGNISLLVAGGTAMRTYPEASGLVGMLMQTPETTVITRLDYSKGDAKPALAQMAFTLPADWSSLFTDAAAETTIAAIQRQLAPEFDVHGRMQRLRSGPTFFFIITERSRPEAVKR
jgi:hypothetical protein